MPRLCQTAVADALLSDSAGGGLLPSVRPGAPTPSEPSGTPQWLPKPIRPTTAGRHGAPSNASGDAALVRSPRQA